MKNSEASSSRDLDHIRRSGRETWLKFRQQQPREDLEQVRRRAREDWLARYRPEKKK